MDVTAAAAALGPNVATATVAKVATVATVATATAASHRMHARLKAATAAGGGLPQRLQQSSLPTVNVTLILNRLIAYSRPSKRPHR